LEKVFGYYHPQPQDLLKGIEWRQADLLDITDLDEALVGCTQLYHCAAQVNFNPKEARQTLHENPSITANVVNAALAAGVKHMVYVSSVAALGRKPGQKYFDENSEWIESKHNTAYAKSKYLAELEVWRGIEEGLPAAIVSPVIVLGPGNWERSSSTLFKTIGEGFSFYSKGVNGFVDARDVAEVMTLLAQKAISEERYVLVAENWSYEKLFKHIADAIGVAGPQVEIKAWLSGSAWRLEKIRSWITGQAPKFTRETANTALQHNYYRNDKVLKELDFKFRDLATSVKEVGAFYRKDQA
jgi:nucleoside-diphosphate-sugar epimerase